jgi:hypothetical protein
MLEAEVYRYGARTVVDRALSLGAPAVANSISPVACSDEGPIVIGVQ